MKSEAYLVPSISDKGILNVCLLLSAKTLRIQEGVISITKTLGLNNTLPPSLARYVPLLLEPGAN